MDGAPGKCHDAEAEGAVSRGSQEPDVLRNVCKGVWFLEAHEDDASGQEAEGRVCTEGW